ncbi:bifunctional 5,10-methylenetetrahydrofolate dehydrogenase/5,10-methenyltetrahydrofolate cyclohydrolase [Candidatus Saccharibacteria bacterium]|nr:bifunctional 5,10-methylenetetrahydrofolate dehydrogenase/5,10-methenyltetrahydrofolate cyclohydrolase [Candidatus Saccharibacteria bacterium]
MQLLSKTIVDQIKLRQITRIQELDHRPKLCVLVANQDSVIESYLRIKASYGREIGVEVLVDRIKYDQIEAKILEYNQSDYDGIVLQLPIDFDGEEDRTDYLLNLVEPTKDIDGLNDQGLFVPPTVMAISRLLDFSEIILGNQIQNVTVVGQGRLVGAPLVRYLESQGVGVTTVDDRDKLGQIIRQSQVIVSAVGNPELIESKWIQPGAIMIDAGTSDDQGAIYGDVDSEALDRDDIYITPPKGGVGPLTVAMLFDNLIKASEVGQSV